MADPCSPGHWLLHAPAACSIRSWSQPTTKKSPPSRLHMAQKCHFSGRPSWLMTTPAPSRSSDTPSTGGRQTAVRLPSSVAFTRPLRSCAPTTFEPRGTSWLPPHLSSMSSASRRSRSPYSVHCGAILPDTLGFSGPKMKTSVRRTFLKHGTMPRNSTGEQARPGERERACSRSAHLVSRCRAIGFRTSTLLKIGSAPRPWRLLCWVPSKNDGE